MLTLEKYILSSKSGIRLPTCILKDQWGINEIWKKWNRKRNRRKTFFIKRCSYRGGMLYHNTGYYESQIITRKEWMTKILKLVSKCLLFPLSSVSSMGTNLWLMICSMTLPLRGCVVDYHLQYILLRLALRHRIALGISTIVFLDPDTTKIKIVVWLV